MLHFTHSDEPDQNRNRRRFLCDKIQKKCIICKDTPKYIVNDICFEYGILSVDGLDGFETVFRMIRRTREVYYNPESYRYTSIKLSESLTKTRTNEEFYRYGPENHENDPVLRDVLIY